MPRKRKNKLIIKPFNLVHQLLFYFNVLIWTLFCLYFKSKGFSDGKTVALVIATINVLLFIGYRYSMKYDEEYINIEYKEYGRINWYNELPLYPCNIMILLNPLAILSRNRYIMAFSFFFSIVCPIPAILTPCAGFEKYSLKKPRIFGFYVTHYLCILNGLLLLIGGMYRPRYSDIIPALAIFIGFSLIAFLVNIFLISSGKNAKANYFFTIKPDGNPVLELFYKTIPVKYLFALPLVIPFGLVFFIITSIVNLRF